MGELRRKAQPKHVHGVAGIFHAFGKGGVAFERLLHPSVQRGELGPHPCVEQALGGDGSLRIPGRQQVYLLGNGRFNGAEDRLHMVLARGQFLRLGRAVLNRIQRHKAIVRDAAGQQHQQFQMGLRGRRALQQVV